MSKKRLQLNSLFINVSQVNLIQPDRLSLLYRKYFAILVLAFTAIGINYFYPMAMMLLTTFTLAYLTKGSRCK